MLNARPLNKITSALALACLAVAVFSPSEVTAAAGGVQNCVVSSSCTVGEFLYDDSSAPISGATCTITSKYPDLTSYVSSTALSGGGSDGWYYYTFTAPTTTGLYPTTISCTVSGDTLSIDKSFQVNAAASSTSVDNNAIAAAVWAYSSRTVTSLANVISDIWKSTVKTTAGVTTTPIDDLATIKKNTSETRLLMEKVVNKPVVQNVLENSMAPLGDKLSGTRSMANQIYVNNQFLTSQSAVLASTWNSASGKDLLDGIIALSAVVGTAADSSDANTMFGQVNWVNSSWSWDESTNIYNQLVATDKIISDLKEGLADYYKTPALYAEAKELVKSSLALEKMVGTVSDTGVQSTLFAKIKTTNDLSLNLDEKAGQVDKVLAAYSKSGDVQAAISQITDLQNQVIALNRVPGAGSALVKVNPSSPNSVTNVLLGLRGIIDSNKILLSSGAGKALLNTWLEVGSIIFKTLATNPSKLVAQDVDIKYYLPQELKKEDIIKADDGLTVNYDTEKDELYVEGTFNLTPGQTKTFSVETKDIWTFTPEAIASLRKQADDLFQPLQKTAYFAQAVSLKSDINANLDQITNLLSGTVTPEDKIKAYRQSAILKNSVDSELTAMKSLVGQMSAQGGLMGFVGGSQTIAVWGIIVIVIAGFVFMTIYMRTIMKKAKREKKVVPEDTILIQKTETIPSHPQPQRFSPAGLVIVMLISSVFTAVSTGFVLNSVISKKYEVKMSVLGAQSAPVATPVPEINDASTGTGGQYLIVVAKTATGILKVRKTPTGEVIGQVKSGDKLPFVDEQDGWYKVELETGEMGWISKEYSSKQ